MSVGGKSTSAPGPARRFGVKGKSAIGEANQKSKNIKLKRPATEAASLDSKIVKQKEPSPALHRLANLQSPSLFALCFLI